MTVVAHLHPFFTLQEIEILHFYSLRADTVSHCAVVDMRFVSFEVEIVRFSKNAADIDGPQKLLKKLQFRCVFSPLLYGLDCWFHLHDSI